MKTASPHSSSGVSRPPTSQFEQRADAMFGSGALRRVGRYGLLATIAFGVLAVGTASADWYVKDRELIEAVGKKGNQSPQTLQGKLYGMRVQGAAYNPKASDDVKSKVATAGDFPEQATIKDRRCKTAEGEQKTVCEALVKLEEDRYKYLQEMRKLSLEREKELGRIYDERNGIDSNDHGKLQSNTNRLMALMAHQRIDQLNLEMAMATFDERIRERKEHQNYLANVAMDPGKRETAGGAGEWLGGAIQLGTLELALNAASTAHER